MNNEMVLYTAASGIQFSQNVSDVPSIMQYNRSLKPRDAEKVIHAVENELYDMAAEYVWSRTVGILKKDILQFGEEFVSEMLDRPNGDIDTISEYEIITLSADLGFINNTAKMEFLQYSETIQHYMSNDDPDEEYPYTKLVDMVRSCVKHVLGYENIKFEVSFASFRDKLKTEIIGTEHPMYEQLLESPYFYKKTITKTLINLAKTLQDGAERENVFVNIGNVISGIWESLSSDDRWSVGRAYAQANNDGDVNFSKAVKSLLIKVKGFDYVPENLRSNSYIIAAKDLLSAHYGANNFYREPSYAKTLCEMGTSIPIPAFGNCMTAILACKLGNTYGISWDAQEYLDKLLDRVSPDRWRYYLANIFPTDEVVLYKLYVQSNALSRFIDIVVKYKLKDISFTNSGIGKLILDLSNGNLTAAKSKCRDLYRKLEQA